MNIKSGRTVYMPSSYCSNKVPELCARFIRGMESRGGCRILARGVLHELLMKRGARASRAKIFVVRIPIFPQIVHVREPGIGN